jgi:hypothetical protein
MFADILQGSQLGPEDGWFKKAVAQTRYDWEATRSRLDADGDGSISPQEFAGPEADFTRLDRDSDGILTAPDFDFSAHALSPSPGMMLFYAADRDGNGKVTPEEFAGLYASFSGGQPGDFLALSDFQQALSMGSGARGSRAAGTGGPSKWTLIKGLFQQEIGSLQAGPAVGEQAPDFTLKTVDGDEEIQLSKLIGPKPVVLVFGNFTCGPFRSQAGNIEKLFLRYGDRANFAMVYVREAHPTDGWSMSSNERVGVHLPQPATYDERAKVAETCRRTLDLDLPMLVDTITDDVGARYSGMPSRLYLIDGSGQVVYKSGRGPFGFKPAELEQSLLFLLNDPPPSPGEPAPAEAARAEEVDPTAATPKE